MSVYVWPVEKVGGLCLEMEGVQEVREVVSLCNSRGKAMPEVGSVLDMGKSD